MPRFLDTRGQPTLAIAICDRCRFKFPRAMLQPDGNIPGLLVCSKCWDEFDPWRLPPPPTENITIKRPRPDSPVGEPTSASGVGVAAPPPSPPSPPVPPDPSTPPPPAPPPTPPDFLLDTFTGTGEL